MLNNFSYQTFQYVKVKHVRKKECEFTVEGKAQAVVQEMERKGKKVQL